MAVKHQEITELSALYNGDCVEVMAGLPPESVHFSAYSPPFGGLYTYSSDSRDLSNARDYPEFMDHYSYVVRAKHRVTMPGRMSAVHCADVPTGNTGMDHLRDFPGDLIRLHEKNGWAYVARYHVWKEPLTLRNRSMIKSLSHASVVTDSTRCSVASADYLLVFRRDGKNPVPVEHPRGLMEYYGEREIPGDLIRYRGWKGSQLENRYSQWVWRQYASAFWDDVRLDRVLPYKAARDAEDERHVHPLQLDVIDRALVLWSNHGETVLTPFMGVGSEVFCAVRAGRRCIGIELKESYYRQALKNLADATLKAEQESLGEIFAGAGFLSADEGLAR